MWPNLHSGIIASPLKTSVLNYVAALLFQHQNRCFMMICSGFCFVWCLLCLCNCDLHRWVREALPLTKSILRHSVNSTGTHWKMLHRVSHGIRIGSIQGISCKPMPSLNSCCAQWVFYPLMFHVCSRTASSLRDGGLTIPCQTDERRRKT